MIDNFIKSLKLICLNTQLVNQVAYGNIIDYTHKEVKYPYVNLDILNSSIINGIVYHNIRFYIMDRNINDLTSFNKTEMILDNIMKEPELQIEVYSATPFVLDYNDMITGFFCDIQIPEVALNTPFNECSVLSIGEGYTTLPDGDLLKNNNGL